MSRVRLHLPRSEFELSVDVELPDRGLTVLFGPSGAGKTTLLRCVAGLERARDGLVKIAHEVWQDDSARRWIPAWKREIGYVFQEPSLFPHLNVHGNLSFGLKRAKGSSEDLAESVKLLGIRNILDRMPDQLSGGERQRVAIARALATRPKLLLLDEPLASLDMPRRQEIVPWLERIRDELGTPMLYVTHSVDEMARLADHIVVLKEGRVQISGPAEEVLREVGLVSAGEDAGTIVQGQVEEIDSRWGLARAAFGGGDLWLKDDGLNVGSVARMRILARDVSLTLDEPKRTSIQNHFPCVVISVEPDTSPAQALVRLDCGGTLLLSRVTARSADALSVVPGLRLWAQVKSVALIR